ncbi:MAG: tRNA (adenosine(37)-N6)-threonylcarbamoyltransferase complex dimerization subunit type 1 TsaB [Pseudomonadales bacterium]|jgi:tRNA threonylcarbamoyladenosine biosynthesis protein TsaB|nr:tRNA (adenosine(37)-N6)-threonylcarbamoyltransferase complex dimerization subunit type 1 TsaB [Pseudomonadales bacterium]
MAAILALETSCDACSVALRVDELLLLEEHEEPRAHARVLLPTIEALLGRAGIGCAELDGIVYGHGPGSFTGLRIGCAVAQGIAWAHELPTLGVSSLALLAEAALRDAREADGTGADAASARFAGVISVLDARMDEFYLAVHGADVARSALLEDRIVARDALGEVLAEALAKLPGPWLVAGDGAAAAVELVDLDVRIVDGARPDARALLALAAPRLDREGVAAAEVRPVYLRDERRWRRQASVGV